MRELKTISPKPIVLCSALIFLLAGCTQYVWKAPPGKGYFEATLDYQECQNYANTLYPQKPLPEPEISGYNCSGSSHGSTYYYSFGSSSSYSNYNLQCKPVYDYTKRNWAQIGENIKAIARDKAFRECMEGKGYRYEPKE